MAKVFKDKACTVAAGCPLASAGYFANPASDVDFDCTCTTECAWCSVSVSDVHVNFPDDGLRRCSCGVSMCLPVLWTRVEVER